MLPRENVPHKLDCMLPGCSTSSVPLSSPLPLTGRPLCPASVLTSLQFFRWWRFRAPWRLLLTAKCGETGARLRLLVQQQLTNFTGRRRSGTGLACAASPPPISLCSRMAKKPALAATSSVTWQQSMCWRVGGCKSTRRPTLKRAKAGQVGNLVSSGQWGAGGKGGLGVG